jgi:hypothetical protein
MGGAPGAWSTSSRSLEKTPTGAAHFGVFRGVRDGIADEGAKRRMTLIAPHVRRAVLIGNAIEMKASEIASFADTLDGLSAAMYLVQANGRIVHSNAAGHMLLARADFLRASGDRLTIADRETNRVLADSLAAAARRQRSRQPGVSLHLANRDGVAYMAHVLPLGARRRAGTAYAAVAAVFVRAPRSTPAIPRSSPGTTDTPAELRSSRRDRGWRGSRVAGALGVRTTVKTHLGNVYADRGVAAGGLVKLAASFRARSPEPPGHRAPRRTTFVAGVLRSEEEGSLMGQCFSPRETNGQPEPAVISQWPQCHRLRRAGRSLGAAHS